MAYIVKTVTGKKSKSKNPMLCISLQGSNGSILNFELNEKNAAKPGQKLFSGGQENSFAVIHSLIGEVNLVQVSNRSPYLPEEDYFLESVTVEDSSGASFTFPCNNWLSPNKGDGRESRSLLRGPLIESKLFKKVAAPLYQNLRATDKTTDPDEAKCLLEKTGTRIDFVNWGQTVEVKNVIGFFPEEIQDVQNIIKLASVAGLRVRSCGATHAWSMLYADEGQVLIDPQNLGPESEKVVLNETKTRLTILPNTTTQDVKTAQLQQKFSLMFNVILESVTYGGTVNTGCHGTGRDQPALPDLVTELQVVDENGDLVTYNEESAGADFMKAVTTNLGLFGFVYKMTLRVEPREVIVETTNQFTPMRDVFYDKDKLKEIVENNFSSEIFWFPFNSLELDLKKAKSMKSLEGMKSLPVEKALGSWDPLNDECWLRLINEKPGGRPVSDLYYLAQSLIDFISHVGLKILTPFLAANPSLNPVMTWLSHSILKLNPRKTIVQELPQAVHFRKFIGLAPVRDIEFAFAVDDDYTNIVDACMACVNIIADRAKRQNFPTNIALEMRFMGKSDSILCPATVGQSSQNVAFKTAYIEVLTLVDTPDWEDFATELSEAWMQIGGKQNVKPLIHWAKETNPVPNFASYLWENNSDKMREFLEHLATKVDLQKRLFFNNFLENVFLTSAVKGKREN